MPGLSASSLHFDSSWMIRMELFHLLPLPQLAQDLYQTGLQSGPMSPGKTEERPSSEGKLLSEVIRLSDLCLRKSWGWYYWEISKLGRHKAVCIGPPLLSSCWNLSCFLWPLRLSAPSEFSTSTSPLMPAVVLLLLCWLWLVLPITFSSTPQLSPSSRNFDRVPQLPQISDPPGPEESNIPSPRPSF